MIRVVDPVADYLQLLRKVFDFDQLRAFVRAFPDFRMAYDSMHAVSTQRSPRSPTDTRAPPN
eukprot:COSAG01_NODE_20148_length_968_cov_1.148446_3_plen_62_part_00